MTYSEKLRDPRWQRKRLDVMGRDGFRCLACGRSDETLHVHHLVYSRGEPWEIEDENLETLCATCHSARTEADSMACFRIRLRPTKEVITEVDRAEYLEGGAQ